MRRLFALSLVFLFGMSHIPIRSSAAEVDETLWEKFLKYDLLITDYDALTAEEQELCRFIFETEQSSDVTIRCERARRTLSGDTTNTGWMIRGFPRWWLPMKMAVRLKPL